MRIAITAARIIVGLLFIFSGLVKANDPLGLSYKMQEFFELWGIAQFNDWTLALSVLIIAFEIIAGAALVIGWQIRLFSWLLLLLILFFTFLTGYAYFSAKFKNCGCFGDCIPISSKTSFLKDIILTLLIGFLFLFRNRITPLLSRRAAIFSMLAVTIFSFGIQWYVLNYLPIVDCLPYAKGNNIAEKMKMPANAVPDSMVITYVYEKDGKPVEFTADKFPADFGDSYTFKSRYDKVVRKGSNNEPPIKGFILTGTSGVDSTNYILSQPYSLLILFENLSVPSSKWAADLKSLNDLALKKKIPLYAVSGNAEKTKQVLGKEGLMLPVFQCDFTAIRTAARTSPCIYLLKSGTILEKKSYHEINDLNRRINDIPSQ